jgi:hypothetical protein
MYRYVLDLYLCQMTAHFLGGVILLLQATITSSEIVVFALNLKLSVDYRP